MCDRHPRLQCKTCRESGRGGGLRRATSWHSAVACPVIATGQEVDLGLCSGHEQIPKSLLGFHRARRGDCGPALLAFMYSVIAILSMLALVYFLFQAPLPCGADTRNGEHCRNNSHGLLLGCWIRQHKWQKARDVFIQESPTTNSQVSALPSRSKSESGRSQVSPCRSHRGGRRWTKLTYRGFWAR